jgi:hypothetical protein
MKFEPKFNKSRPSSVPKRKFRLGLRLSDEGMTAPSRRQGHIYMLARNFMSSFVRSRPRSLADFACMTARSLMEESRKAGQ